jgi:hypothetical protein
MSAVRSKAIRRAGLVVTAAALVTAALGAVGAGASQLVDRNATDVTLQVNDRDEALLTYTVQGRVRHVLAWGAVNALPPTEGGQQERLQLDYSGGYGKYFAQNTAAQKLVAAFRKIRFTPGYLAKPVTRELQQTQQAADLYWKTAFHGGCLPYDGPPLAWALITCKAPDGSYWAVQQWQRGLPDYGVQPDGAKSAWELRLSHWTGALPVLTVHTDWSWRRWDHLYGQLTYLGQAAYGFLSSSLGQPLDGFGRNVYVDTYDSAYGPGWRRENSVLTHKGTGVFCYSVNPHGDHPAGKGSEYRVTVIGPGVTPDLMWQGPAPGRYSPPADAAANARIAALHDRLCRPN